MAYYLPIGRIFNPFPNICNTHIRGQFILLNGTQIQSAAAFSKPSTTPDSFTSQTRCSYSHRNGAIKNRSRIAPEKAHTIASLKTKLFLRTSRAIFLLTQRHKFVASATLRYSTVIFHHHGLFQVQGWATRGATRNARERM